MNINGTLISYFFYCNRKCWLFYNQIRLEDNSEDVRIGKILHELEAEKGKSEILIDGIKIDKITKSYIVEYKKADTDIESCEMQVLLYLYKLKQKGVSLKGRIEFKESKEKKQKIVELNEINEKKLINSISNVENLLMNDIPPEPDNLKKCRKCAYKDYCFI